MRKQESVKIQINSLEALERLIGGDPSLEFDIRNNVAQNFAAKHLKAFANSEAIKGLEKRVTDMVFTKKQYNKTELNPNFKKKIEDAADTLFKDLINDKLAKLERSVYDTMNKKLDEFDNTVRDEIIRSITSEKMQDIINKKVDHKLKTMMKLLVEQDDPKAIVNSVEDLK